jgi:hypothetical protein
VNALLLVIGGASATGASTSTLLGAAGALLGALAAALAALVAKLAQLLEELGRASLRGAQASVAGLRRGIAAFGVWREQRARRTRVAAARDERVVERGEADGVPAAEDPARVPLRRPRAGDPTIVDHEAERSGTPGGRQEAFHFAEATSSTATA